MGFLFPREGTSMKRREGKLPSRVTFENGVYKNEKVLTDMNIGYIRRGMEDKKWYLGVVEFEGQTFNLDDPYDFQLILIALIYAGVIRKHKDTFEVIDPQCRFDQNPYIVFGRQSAFSLLLNLSGRTLRVLNEHDLQNYNEQL
jgi:hypothetical protein